MVSLNRPHLVLHILTSSASSTMPDVSAVAPYESHQKLRSAMHEGMDGWKENGCPPALEAGVEVGWDGKAGAASDVTRGDWEEGSGRLNGIEGLLGRRTARLPASHHHHHRRRRGLGRGSPCSGFQEEQLVCHFCARRKHSECPDVSATHALL